MDFEAYLSRIGYHGTRAPKANSLRELHRAHLLSIPFENLDIPAKVPIVRDTERLLEKVVTRRRGGFCYELNGAFCWLLQRLGYEATMLSARVARRDGSFSPEFDHMALEVRDIDGGCWLADVGFGDCFVEPLSLTDPSESEQVGWTYRLIESGAVYSLERRSAEADWKPQYEFTRTPHTLKEFAPMCLYHQTSPDSFFTQRRVCSLATVDGRITLEGYRLITTHNGTKSEREVTGDEEYRRLLREKFGVRQ